MLYDISIWNLGQQKKFSKPIDEAYTSVVCRVSIVTRFKNWSYYSFPQSIREETTLKN